VSSRSPGSALVVLLLLLAAAALDLTRCGIVAVTAGRPAPAAGLIAAGLAAAGLSLRTACGCRGGRRWAAWAALLIGAMSAPQAAASGFRPPYTIPDVATAAVGILLTVTVLATAGRPGQPGPGAGNACVSSPPSAADQSVRLR
jgi:hypothetical protein